MGLFIFWLTPVILVVLFLVVLSQNKVSNKPKMFIVEPLLYLVKKWEMARVEGDEKNTRRLFSYWLPGLEMQQSIVEQLVRQVSFQMPIIPEKNITILNQKTLPFWAEERELELRGKKTSVLAGPISEVIAYCDADVKGQFTRESANNWLKNAESAYSNGFWALALAESSSDEALLNKKYRLVGLIILEPVLDNKAEGMLRQMTAIGKVKILSYLPPSFIEQLVQKVFPSRIDKSITGKELSMLMPQKQEDAMGATTIFGEMAQKNRYYVARHFRGENFLTIVSNVPQDNDLPADKRV